MQQLPPLRPRTKLLVGMLAFFDNRRIKSVIPQIGWSCDGENFSPENHTYRTLPSFEKKAEAVSDITRVISC